MVWVVGGVPATWSTHHAGRRPVPVVPGVVAILWRFITRTTLLEIMSVNFYDI